MIVLNKYLKNTKNQDDVILYFKCDVEPKNEKPDLWSTNYLYNSEGENKINRSQFSKTTKVHIFFLMITF